MALITSSTYRVNSPHVVHEVFDDGEAAIINLKTGSYYSLDPVGAVIWGLIDQGYSTGEIVENLVQRYDGSLVAIVNDVGSLVAALLAEDLIAPAAAAEAAPKSGRPTTAPATRMPYTTPAFERFNDMQELLLLDPIHEVGEEGWPHAKAGEA